MKTTNQQYNLDSLEVCHVSDLINGSGVAVLVGKTQIALFYLPDLSPGIFAVDNTDPITNANVIARGIVGDIKGELVVASPLYKDHFCLKTGRCIEKPEYSIGTYRVEIEAEHVRLWL